MLREMGLLGLGKLALALLLFLGPGYGLCSFFPNRKAFDKTHRLLLSFAFSASFWALLMSWLQPIRIQLSFIPVLVIALAGWGIGIFREARSGSIRVSRAEFLSSTERVLLWVLLVGIVLVGLYAVRNRVVGSGSDSYHHTLIAQLIFDQGRLLDNYQPVTDQIVTFTYHFGFHVMVAVVGWLSGLPTHWIVLVLGILWIALAALSSAFLTEVLTGSQPGGLAAAAVTGVLCVFPTQMLSWGRYPQFAGLILMVVFLGLFFQALENTKVDFWQIAFLGILAAGLGSMHYRASLLTMVGAGTLFLVMFITSGLRRYSWKLVFSKLAGIGGVTLLLFLPWIWHVISTRTVGYALIVPAFDPTYFSPNRVGAFVLNYPTNFPLLAAFGVAVGWGLLCRDRGILWLVVWTGACLVLSMPRFAGVFLDFVSVAISGYIPLAVGIGWLAAELAKPRRLVGAWGKTVLIVLLAGITLFSMPSFIHNVQSGTAFVQPDDLKAIEWIRDNTSPSAYFMVNLYHFEFSPDLIIALDAGYWLPLLSGRKTVSLPMSYMSEKFRTAAGIDSLKQLDELKGHLCNPDAQALLVKEGVTHVFVGSVGGPIAVQELLNCPDFHLEFQHRSAYVFRFTPQKR